MKKKLFFIFVVLFTVASCSPMPAASSESAGSEVEQVATPVSVDLSEITPEKSEAESAEESDEAVEAPAPRTRNSEAKLLHEVSLDLSKRLGIDIGKVTEVEITEVTWPNSALGCPVDGAVYTAAEVEGFQITLEAEGEEYVYHSRGFETFLWCDDGMPVEPVDG